MTHMLGLTEKDNKIIIITIKKKQQNGNGKLKNTLLETKNLFDTLNNRLGWKICLVNLRTSKYKLSRQPQRGKWI